MAAACNHRFVSNRGQLFHFNVGNTGSHSGEEIRRQSVTPVWPSKKKKAGSESGPTGEVAGSHSLIICQDHLCLCQRVQEKNDERR